MALYNRVKRIPKPKKDGAAGLCVTMPADSEEKFKTLMEGETKYYNGDH
jgi:hypothetical protein